MLSGKILLGFLISCFIGVVFSCERINNPIHENGLYLVKINYKKNDINVYVSDSLETVDLIAQKLGAKIVINTGFFDAKNKKTVSYILQNENILANPRLNENLTKNPELISHLDKILNRAEFRLYNCNGEKKADIAFHNQEYLEACELLHSTQAGPLILPFMDLEKEFFIFKKDGQIVRDSIGVNRKTSRAALALKGDFLYLIITDEKNPMTMQEFASVLKKYNFEKAMGLDGGGSVSLFVKTKQGVLYQAREANSASRPVKSVLFVK